ncbi:Hypothetical_protein [Hexamita inflata]|uniref:Hypothetical_protein n=1 Tax=Hexamita inflata TaxID=28002 RepID=A0ABP1JH14_9EUKA
MGRIILVYQHIEYLQNSITSKESFNQKQQPNSGIRQMILLQLYRFLLAAQSFKLPDISNSNQIYLLRLFDAQHEPLSKLLLKIMESRQQVLSISQLIKVSMQQENRTNLEGADQQQLFVANAQLFSFLCSHTLPPQKLSS